MEKKYTRVTRLFNRIFRFRYWLDFERLKQATLYLIHGTKTLFTPQITRKKQHFETVAKKFQMTDAKLKTQEYALLWWGRLLFLIGLGIGGWGVYHFSTTAYRASLTSFVVMGIAFALAFRYHFFAFQIQQRKLGCTFQEWVREGLIRRKK